MTMDGHSIISRRPQVEHYKKETTGRWTRTTFRLHSYELVYRTKCSLHRRYETPYLGARYSQQQNSFLAREVFALLVNIKQRVIAQRLSRNNINIKTLKFTHQTEKKMCLIQICFTNTCCSPITYTPRLQTTLSLVFKNSMDWFPHTCVFLDGLQNSRRKFYSVFVSRHRTLIFWLLTVIVIMADGRKWSVAEI
jgi:hypothetical protein